MNNLEVVNILIYILSFLIFFCALVMDFKDAENGNILRRVAFFFLMLANCSFMIKAVNKGPDGLTIIWLLFSIVMLIAKYVQLKGSDKRIDDKIRSVTHSIRKTSAHKRATHQ